MLLPRGDQGKCLREREIRNPAVSRRVTARCWRRGLIRAAAGRRQDRAGWPGRALLRELIDDGLLDALLERSRDEAGGLRLTGEGSMLGELVKAVLERALEAELTAHLGYDKNERVGRGGSPLNYRNGTIAKTVQTGVGPVDLVVPRDRAGTFEPLLLPNRATANPTTNGSGNFSSAK